VHDRVDTLKLCGPELADVERESLRNPVEPRIEPPVLVVAGVDSHDVVSGSQQFLGCEAAEISLCACDQNAHSSSPHR
jgi:hypothetical protein